MVDCHIGCIALGRQFLEAKILEPSVAKLFGSTALVEFDLRLGTGIAAE